MALFFFPNITSANTYLNENSTWGSDLTGSSWTSITLGDIDNDGDLDLAHIGCTGTSGSSCDSYLSKIYINNGTGFAENSTWQSNLTAVHYGSIAWGDIDNDGDLDLALTGCNNGGGSIAVCNNGEQSFIYINNGTSLIENSSWKGDITDVWKGSIAFEDINLDGKLDLALTGQSSTDEIAKIYINNGTGFAENSTWQQNLTGVFESAIALGDTDNDGKLDLILTGNDGTDETAKVYINNGSSLVENTTWQQNLLAVDTSAIALGDYDNNGRMDLTLIGHTTHDNHEIYNNTGTTFQLLQSEATGTGSLVGIFEGTQVFGGYDNDGDLDLITSGEEEYTTLYLYNVSGSQFTHYLNDPEPDIFNTAFGPSTAWGDFDNDGDLDLVLIGVDSSDIIAKAKIYTNTITTPNTAPNPPTNFTSSYASNKLTLSWNNGSDTETSVLGLYYNLRVGTNNGSHDTVSGVYGGGDDNGYFGNMMQRKLISLNIANSTYYWAVQTIDTALKAGSWSREQIYPLDTTDPSITVNSPVNNTNSSNATITFNATVSDDVRLENVSLFANFSGTFQENETNTSGINNTDYIFTKNISDGSYIWSIRACDYYGSNCTFSENRTIMIDSTAPSVTVLAPTNNSLLETADIIVRAQFSDANIVNCKVRNDSDNWQNMDNDNKASGIANYTFTGLSATNHNLTINCSDILLSTIKTINFTIDTSGQDNTKPNIAITLPKNNSYLDSSSVTLNVNFNDSTNTNCQAKIDTNSWQNMDNDGATSGIANYTFTSVSDDNHSIAVNCTDGNNNNATANISFAVDTTYPAITSISPTNASSWTSSSTVTFNYNVTDIVIDNCSLIINNDKLVNDTTIAINTSQEFSRSLSNAVYNWSINCTDKAGNENNSKTRRITVSYSSGNGNGGGGGGGGSSGGGGGTVVSSKTNLDTKPTFTTVGYTAKQTQGDTATFTVEGEKYTAELSKLREDSVTITVAGASSVFKPGESKEFDVNNDGTNDISVTLSKITGGRAEIVYKMLVKPEEEKEVIEEEKEEVIEEKPIEIKEEKSKIWLWLLAILGCLLIGLIIGYFYIERKSRK